MSYRIHNRKFDLIINQGASVESVETGALVRMAASQSADGRGLTTKDQLMLSDLMARCREFEHAEYIIFENAEFDHLKRKVDEARWPITGDDVARFIRDVEDAKRDEPLKIVASNTDK